mgnify:CR=1 FL=1
MSQVQKSTMIRLRQGEGVRNVNTDINGDYQVTLAKPIKMEQGDTVRVHTAILDASAPDVINIPELVECEIDVCRYINYYSNPTFPAGPERDGAAGTEQNYVYERVGVPAKPAAVTTIIPPSLTTPNQKFVPTNSRYWAGIQGKPAGGDVYRVNSIVIQQLIQGAATRWSGVPLTFQFISPLTGEQTTRTYTPKHRSSIHQTQLIEIETDIVGNDNFNSFKCINSAGYLYKHGIEQIAIFSGALKQYSASISFTRLPAPGAQDIYTNPYIETIKFSIEPRRYGPAELCTIINDKISTMNAQGPTGMTSQDLVSTLYPTTNPFFGTARQMTNAISTNNVDHSLAFFKEVASFDEDCTEQIILNVANLVTAHNDMWVGANEIALNYDPVLEKMNFDIMHMPIYVPLTGGTGFVPGVEFSVDGTVAATYSGVTIMGLRPELFWVETMGFDQMINTAQSQTKSFQEVPLQIDKTVTPNVPYANTPSGNFIYPFKMIATVGVNVTDTFLGIDLPVTKDAHFFATANGATQTALTATSTDLTTPIYSTRTFDNPVTDEGYFLIEISFAFQQKLIGGGSNAINNNVQSIVGKYFTSKGNFLQDQGGGSITYEHMGEAQLLTNIGVRILDASGNQLPNTVLGPLNSIFLEMAKTLNIPAPVPVPIKK